MSNVLVASLRKGTKPIPSGFTPIRIDRKHPVLGNPHVMKGKSQTERDRVIRAFRHDLNQSRLVNGELWKDVVALADRVERGEKIALQCWCAPKDCHGDVIASAIDYILQQRAA